MTYRSDAISNFNADYARTRRSARRIQVISTLLFAAAVVFSAYVGGFFAFTDVTLPGGQRVSMLNIWAGLPRLGEYLEKTIPRLRIETLGSDLAEWFWRWKTWLRLLFETILIAYVATVLAVFGGFILSFFAARNLAPGRIVSVVARRYLEIIRTVPELVWALIFVFCFGVGPLAGVLAIGLHATGSLGKLYSEANENIDMRPLEGIKASGGNWFQQMRYGAVPQVIPNVIS